LGCAPCWTATPRWTRVRSWARELADAGLAGLLVSLPVVFVASLLTSPLLEEPGWRGFALPHLQDRLTALAAGVLLGFVEGLWQLPIALAGREPLLAYFLGVTGSFTVLVWIFNGTGGSLVVALLYHASLNLAAGPLQFDPGDLVAPLLTWLVVGLLVVGYGARDPARQQRFTWQQRPAR
jgi:CAAX protease family protein